MEGRRGDTRLRLVYIIGTYPLLTTTFIDREVRILRRWGADVRIVAVRRPGAEVPLSSEQRALQRGVRYLLPVAWRDLILSHLFFLTRRPGRLLSTFIYLLTRPHPTLRSRLKTVLHVGEGVYAAYLVRDRGFDELHAHFADRAATIAMVAARLLAKPYSLSIHASLDVFVQPVLLREKIEQVRHVATCTEHNRVHVLSLVGDDLAPKITHVPHGLDLTEYAIPQRRVEGIPVVLAVGQLVARKGFADLIATCAELRDRGYRFECRIVGDGPQSDELRASVRRLALEGLVTLCGALPHDRVLEQYAQAAVFVLPCVRTRDGDVDGIPNAIAEAMAMRVPVVSTDLPAIRELVSDRVNGSIVPPGDAASLADAIAHLLDDPALRGRMGDEGRRTVEDRFDVEQNVGRFVSTLWPDRLDREVAVR